MEKLYIKVDENSVFVDHPHFERNVRELYPDHDFEAGPPIGWMEFVRVEPPELGVYELFDETIGGNIALAFSHNGLSYDIVDGVYKDVWHTRSMTEEEKTEKQNEVKSYWADFITTSDGAAYSHYVFDEEHCAFVDPEG